MKNFKAILFLIKIAGLIGLFTLPFHAQSSTEKQLTESLNQFISEVNKVSEDSLNYLVLLSNNARANNWEEVLVEVEIYRLLILGELNKIDEVRDLTNAILPV